MRAVVCDRYGPPEVLRLDDVQRPVPKDDEVLIKIRAATVNRTDCAFRQAKPFVGRLFTGPLRPKWQILGYELAGEVEAVGPAVTEFLPGDQVFGVNAGLSADKFGAHAEFICMRQSAPLAPKPAGMTFEEAAAVCDGAILALGPSERQACTRGSGSSSMAHLDPSGPRRSSWPATSMPTSPRCAIPGMPRS
jgi:NADPH:quinone reductase-like Zn-dependent oxidoreductase